MQTCYYHVSFKSTRDPKIFSIPSFIEKNDDADRVKLLDGNLNVSKVFERKFGYLIQGEEWNFRI